MAEVKKNDITREQLIILMARYIKECAKEITETNPYYRVSLTHRNWVSCGKEKKWSNTEIIFNYNHYHFYDKEITESDFLTIVSTALKESNCKGNIKTKTWEEPVTYGWKTHYVEHKEFDELILMGKPCKEFKTLQNLVKKYSGTTIGECEIYCVNVCGKRSSWNKGGDYNYLDYNKKVCQKAIDFIRGKRTSKDTMECKIQESLNHGEDYEEAMRYETEWYGSFQKYLEINVFTPKGKNKGNAKVSCSYSY